MSSTKCQSFQLVPNAQVIGGNGYNRQHRMTEFHFSPQGILLWIEIFFETSTRWSYLVVLVLSVFACSAPTETVDVPDEISFNFDIRPILSDNCYVCHGPDSSSRQAGLRLDQRTYAINRLEDGKRAIVPGNWKKSELIHRVSSTDPEIMMPPPEMKRHLSEREIALLKKWISKGADWEPYWAFISPTAVDIPDVNQNQYLDNAIDSFIVNKLESSDLTPAAKVDKFGLARRLSFTLTGLPPTIETLQNFASDRSDKAYEKLVDQYLNSPRFGEYWARHWMDLVRYADTRGHEFDYKVVGAWQYRDYLIRAFNNDVPYDQLIMEQIAGDLLAVPRVNEKQGFNESAIGTAFYCLTEGKHSPVDLRIDQSERIDNIIDVTSKTFQALTVACSKCHDHKFDPIPTTDYYSMYGMVESSRFTLIQAGFDSYDQQVLDSLNYDNEQVKSYIIEHLSDLPETSLTADEKVHFKGAHDIIGDFRDGSLDEWKADGYAFVNSLGFPKIQNDRIVGLESGKASSSVKGKGLFGVLRSPGFIIDRDSLLFRAAGLNSIIRVIIDNHQLIQNPIYGQLQTHVKSEKLKDYKIDVSMWKGHHAYIELMVGDYRRRKDKGFHEYDLDPGAWLDAEYVVNYDSSFSQSAAESVGMESEKSVSELIDVWKNGTATEREIKELGLWFSTNKPAVKGIDRWYTKQQNRVTSLYDSSFVVGITDGDHIQSPVFIRGSLKNLSSYKVPHRFLTAVSDTTDIFQPIGSGRLEFAKHVANPQNPLTARVMVNRLWHHIFGRGIVETVDNFGVQGKIPSHPKLLDHLALKFIEHDWSIKKMIKYMVMSQSFQRETTASKASMVVDPDNLLLQHFPVRRINAESIRDAVLAASGRLDTTMYGPSIPMYLTEFLTGRGRPKKSGPLDGDGRRSIYQAINRNFLPPMMLAFDMPIPFSTFGKRNVSNVPSQSLTMLNDPFIVDQAEVWAKNVMAEPGEFNGRIENIYLKAFARAPSEQELEQARIFFEEQLALMDDKADEQNIEMELWKSYCHSVFNMKEFIFLI